MGHPDHKTGTDDDLVDVEVRVVGAIVISLRPEPAPFGGPWITEVWRDPGSPAGGRGGALIERVLAMLHEDGFGTLGLAVTDTNPARRTYERLGFESANESWTLMLPVGPASPASLPDENLRHSACIMQA